VSESIKALIQPAERSFKPSIVVEVIQHIASFEILANIYDLPVISANAAFMVNYDAKLIKKSFSKN
jgi:hypothetical protein